MGLTARRFAFGTIFFGHLFPVEEHEDGQAKKPDKTLMELFGKAIQP
jgi:hypothetical protein